MTLDEAREHIGHGVVYHVGDHRPDEDGVITSVNDRYIFVRYANQHPGADGVATHPRDLTLLSP